ncbi:DUF4395 domain-containing protein [Paenibacillus psychroresistens]|uniref:DUF4395 domain-containing protein n=1 Tax=Paenibacillus psychroresistens TaxID=1778678 RepID=A0A6B8RR99_9BACL|nr:DUF4395 domain-containing protein [Paenibacillus psychroresistens]QGQ98013.1 DUF4395 domain-containing protein [Paenibacillus psychroresistens]
MREIPMTYIKSNQVGIVLFVLLATFLKLPQLLVLLWLIQVVGLVFGYNLFVRLAKPFLNVKGSETQAAELQRFNNVLAILFITLAVLAFTLKLTMVGYVFSFMLFLAALAAICGYCIGCTVYYQYKQYIARHRST